jgi:hypothetical protein
MRKELILLKGKVRTSLSPWRERVRVRGIK